MRPELSSLQSPKDWFRNHLGTISRMYVRGMQQIAEGATIRDSESLRHRRMTELSFCNLWPMLQLNNIDLPEGYHVQNGFVVDIANGQLIRHTYLERNDEETRKIFCHSGAQLPFYSDHLEKGEGVEILKRKAKDAGKLDLVTMVSNFCIIDGTDTDIESALGYKYITFDDFFSNPAYLHMPIVDM